MKEDPELLRCFVREKSEAAFRELVQRRIDFVYGAALRQVGDVHLAEEVTQNVFLDLARKAATLAGRPNLLGWLYTSTRFAAAKALRARSRRVHYETEAHAMHEILSIPPAAEVNWSELRPVLDEAMHELTKKEREAILLRYFDGRSLADIGVNLGLAENSARMRVDRALEKLRERLARRGITSTAAALGAALTAQPAVAAPAGLAASVSAFSLATPAVSIFNWLSTQKIAALSTATILGVAAHSVAASRIGRQIHAERLQQEQELARLGGENRERNAEGEWAAKETAARVASAATTTPLVDPLDRLRGVMRLMSEGSVVPGRWRFLPPAGDIFGIIPGMTINGEDRTMVFELFALTRSETATLRQAGEVAKQKIAALAIANGRVERNGNQLTMELRPVPESQVIYERLLETIRQTLGAERFGYFEKIGWGAALKTQLDSVGLEGFAEVITHLASPRLPHAPYESRRSKVWDSNGKPGMGGGAGGGDRASLRINLGPLDALIPQDF